MTPQDQWDELNETLTGQFPAYDLVRVRHFLHDHPGWAAAYLRLAQRLGDFCRFQEARRALQCGASLLRLPHSAFIEAQGELYFEAERHGLAQRYFRAALELGPEEEWVRLRLACSLRLQGRLAEAKSWLRKTRDPLVAQEWGYLFRTQEQWDEARHWFKIAEIESALRDLDESRQVSKWSREELMSREGGPVTGLLAGRRLQQLRPNCLSAHIKQAEALAALRRLPEALAHVRYLGHRPEARLLYAALLKKCGRYQRAVLHFLEIAREGRETAPWIFAGCCLARLGKLQQAEDCHRQALQCVGDPDEGMYNLALVLRAQGRYQEALACAHQALEMSPDWAGPDFQELIADLEKAILG